MFTEGVDRFFNLTLFVHDEIEPGLEVVVVLDIMPGSTAMSMSCIRIIMYSHHNYVLYATSQMSQIL